MFLLRNVTVPDQVSQVGGVVKGGSNRGPRAKKDRDLHGLSGRPLLFSPNPPRTTTSGPTMANPSGISAGSHFLIAFRQFVRQRRCPPRILALRELSTGSAQPGSARHRQVSLHRDRVRWSLIPGSARLYSSSGATTTATTTIDTPESASLSQVTIHRKEKVLLLMSGGVDSSMCAHILCQQGYDVTGLYMHNWNHQEETQDELASGAVHPNNTQFLTESATSKQSTHQPNPHERTARIRPKVCTSDRDWADVQAVCEQLGIPARRLDFSRQYWNQVFEVMLQEYERGRTPNPDVTCNKEIKFGELIDWCDRNGGLGKDRHGSTQHSDANGSTTPYSLPETKGWDFLATGHYARVERDLVTGRARLLRAVDSNKDQTYYLSTLSERVLRNVLFPLAQYDKPTVKKMALTTGTQQIVMAAKKKESMGICFVGQRKRFGDFLREYLDGKPGVVKANGLDGLVLGKHKGLFQYTVGQASGVANGPQK